MDITEKTKKNTKTNLKVSILELKLNPIAFKRENTKLLEPSLNNDNKGIINQMLNTSKTEPIKFKTTIIKKLIFSFFDKVFRRKYIVLFINFNIKIPSQI